MYRHKTHHPIRNTLAVTGILGAMFALGYYVAVTRLTTAVEFAYDAGYKQAIDKQDWKQLALVDRDYSNRLCNNWWFQATHRERKVSK
jgi:hypothetical protein